MTPCRGAFPTATRERRTASERAPRTRTAERLAATDALHQDERLLRRGWVFVVGSTDVEGLSRRVCLPLLSEPVRPAYRLVAVKRAGIYVARDVFSASQRETLRNWAARPGLETTALAWVYGVGDGGATGRLGPRRRDAGR